MNTGFGPFYDGLAHVFVTPEDLLPVVALSLLAGLGGPGMGRAILFALPTAWITGSLVGFAIGWPSTPPALTAGMMILLGALVASNARLPLVGVRGLAVLLGLLNGGLNGIELAGASSGALAVGGIAAALFVVVSLLAGQIASLRADWMRIAVRVAGSWVVATGMLMLGWSMRGT